PGTDGKGNQPSLEKNCLSVVRPAPAPGFQSPCSSIAALPLARFATELFGTDCAGVPRKPVWNGLVFMKLFRSALALAKHGALRLTFFLALPTSDFEHSRMAKYSQ